MVKYLIKESPGVQFSNFYIIFTERDYDKFRGWVAETEEMITDSQLPMEVLYNMWAERRNFVVHKLIDILFGDESRGLRIVIHDDVFNDNKRITINTSFHKKHSCSSLCSILGLLKIRNDSRTYDWGSPNYPLDESYVPMNDCDMKYAIDMDF